MSKRPIASPTLSRKVDGSSEHFGIGNPRTPEPVIALAYPEPNSGCWLWTGKIGVRNGYGIVNFQRKRWFAHRLVYTLDRGEIQPGLQIDHLCRNRACVNPDHLEPVTARENIRRGSVFKNIGGVCRECGREINDHARGCNPCRKRKYRERHPDRVRAQARSHYAANPEKYSQYRINRKKKTQP